MKFFPESWVPDPDKKFSPLDESLIAKIIAGVLKSNPKFEFIESKHVRQDGGEYNQMIISSFKKGKKDFGYVFYKISEYNKKNFIHMDEMVDDYCSATGYDFNDLTDRFVASHAKALHLHPDFDLIGAVDPVADRREMFAQRYGKATYANVARALEHCRPELVV